MIFFIKNDSEHFFGKRQRIRIRANLSNLLILLLLALQFSACASRQVGPNKIYRQCDGRVSYVICPGAPPGYQALEIAASGKAVKLRDNEKAAMTLILADKPDAEKLQGLRAMGFESGRGADILEYLMCSQYVDCVIPIQQYHDARKNLIRALER